MKSIHLKCEDRKSLKCIKMPTFESGYWDIPDADADQLIGGMVYLHQTKNEPSYIGGIVKEVRQEKRPEHAHSDRWLIVFDAVEAGKGTAWRGADHTMAWYSGLVDG
jgi:hypothetical protein